MSTLVQQAWSVSGHSGAEAAAPLEPTELAEARAHLPRASREELAAFVLRQRECRRHLAGLEDFYRAHPCRMTRVHLLVSSAVMLGRFWGMSAPFARLGEAVMPVDASGWPRTQAWEAYARACEEGLPIEVRDELWIDAHMRDVAQAREAGLEAAFLAEARLHAEEPLWRLLVQHLEMTLGARLFDQPALAGAVPGETAMAHGMALAVGRLIHAGWSLLRHYALATARALLWSRGPGPEGLLGDRRGAWLLLSSFLTAWTAARVYRRGVRSLRRGQQAGPTDSWPLLAATLGGGVAEVDARVVRFYSNPGAYTVSASVDLRGRGAHLIAWLATRLLGQGVSESGARAFPARFRTFRRVDGTMHFVRELYCHGALRVFDSDFVVRSGTLYEVFVEQGLEVEMEVRALECGGVSIRGRRVRWRGLPLPTFGLRVEFRTCPAGEGSEQVDIIGTLSREPRPGAQESPQVLGLLRYRAERGGPWTPRFRDIFAKAGMSMEDPANKMPLEGHYGPHPQQYHEIIFRELDDAMRGCRSVVECRGALTSRLRQLAKEIATSGTELNQLVTK
ncbi:MAG: AHH domain-containing protein [Hyalangium sp.]|uniref:AHH domain-containing protein n=1 Tax=Hyalangium sp. TaxID=2028555 RepID=UPI00389A971B